MTSVSVDQISVTHHTHGNCAPGTGVDHALPEAGPNIAKSLSNVKGSDGLRLHHFAPILCTIKKEDTIFLPVTSPNND